jgi:hypothetical protein
MKYQNNDRPRPNDVIKGCVRGPIAPPTREPIGRREVDRRPNDWREYINSDPTLGYSGYNE